MEYVSWLVISTNIIDEWSLSTLVDFRKHYRQIVIPTATRGYTRNQIRTGTIPQRYCIISKTHGCIHMVNTVNLVNQTETLLIPTRRNNLILALSKESSCFHKHPYNLFRVSHICKMAAVSCWSRCPDASSLVGNVIGEPVKSLVQPFARCSTSALNVPAPEGNSLF